MRTVGRMRAVFFLHGPPMAARVHPSPCTVVHQLCMVEIMPERI